VNNCKEDFYDYIVSFIYDNTDYLQLTCLTQGEGGNILCVLKTEPNSNYSLGRELKRMMDDGTNSVFVNFCSGVYCKVTSFILNINFKAMRRLKG